MGSIPGRGTKIPHAGEQLRPRAATAECRLLELATTTKATRSECATATEFECLISPCTARKDPSRRNEDLQ